MDRNQNHKQFGFTVVELLVVFVIMILLSSLVVINWNKQKPTRSLVIAQNELITNLRKVQSYAVSSRNISAGSAAKFYLVEFNENATSYTVDAINSDGTLTGAPLEQISLPAGLSFSAIELEQTEGGRATPYDCLYAIFSVVYGKTYFLGDNMEVESFGLCGTTNVEGLVADPVVLARHADSDLILSIKHNKTNVVKSVRVDAQTGRVEPYTVQGWIAND